MAATPHATQSESTVTSALKRREEEAERILRTSTDFKHIRLVCVWFPFPEHKVVRLLSTRWMARLDSVLQCVRREPNDSHRDTWNNEGFKVHKAEEILKSLKSEEPPSTRRDIVESLPSLDSAMEVGQMTYASQMAYASRIALAVDSRISTAFYNTPFSEVVRAALGLKPPAFQRLVDVASQLRTELSKLFRRLDQPSRMYELVQQELQFRDPLVRWILYTSRHDDSPDLCRSFSFLFHPIQVLFARQDLTVITILECVAVLAVHYNDKVVGGTHGDWKRFCSADSFFPEWLGNLDPHELAQHITDNDVDRFLNLCVIDFRSKTAYFRTLETQWDVLAETVKACCLALPGSIAKISKIVECLIRFRNFYSATAFLIGLLNAQQFPDELALFWRLVNTEDHYAFYQSQWSRAPALPFLPPHTYGKHPERKIYDLFKFVLYPEWRQQKNEDDLDNYTASEPSWRDASSESDQKASEESGAWCIILAFLNFLVFLLRRFFPLRRSVAHGSLNTDVETCLSGSQTSVISLSLRDTQSITLSHCPPIQEMEFSAPTCLRPVHLRNEGVLSESQMHFDPRQPPLTYEELSYSPAPASWRALAWNLDPEWDLWLPLKRREGLKRIFREPRFRRKTQYCCKCSRRRKYNSTQYCTCNHRRCDVCKGLLKTTEERT